MGSRPPPCQGLEPGSSEWTATLGGVALDGPANVVDDSPLYMHVTSLEVDVIPAKRQQFTHPETRGGVQPDHGTDRLLEECENCHRLLWSQDDVVLCRATTLPRVLDRVGLRISGQKSVTDAMA